MSEDYETQGLHPLEINQLFADHFSALGSGDLATLTSTIDYIEELDSPFIKEASNTAKMALEALWTQTQGLPFIEDSVYWGVRAYAYSEAALDYETLEIAAAAIGKDDQWLKDAIWPDEWLIRDIGRSFGDELEKAEKQHYRSYGYAIMHDLELSRPLARWGREVGSRLIGLAYEEEGGSFAIDSHYQLDVVRSAASRLGKAAFRGLSRGFGMFNKSSYK